MFYLEPRVTILAGLLHFILSEFYHYTQAQHTHPFILSDFYIRHSARAKNDKVMKLL
jgi:hypothetical protein